jgi:hypothetical protein
MLDVVGVALFLLQRKRREREKNRVTFPSRHRNLLDLSEAEGKIEQMPLASSSTYSYVERFGATTSLKSNGLHSPLVATNAKSSETSDSRSIF